MKSYAPHTVHRTPQATVNLVLKLRQEKRWGPCKIAGYLKKHSRAVAPVSHVTVYKILVKADPNNSLPKPRRVWGKTRFERLYSNSLWQADFKLTSPDEWMISYLDDHSRFGTGSEVHHPLSSNETLSAGSRNLLQIAIPIQYSSRDGA